MLLRLRVTLPNRPGAFGRVTRVLGALGADILSVTVLGLRRLSRLVDITLAIAGDRLDEPSAGVRAATGEART